MIKFQNLRVELDGFSLQNINLQISDQDYFIILGPTGAGKTVLLESLAGLYPVKSGRVWLNERNITDLKPEKRGISIVYQDQSLFPHLSVKDNILFGLKLRKQSVSAMVTALDWIVDLLDVSHLLSRRPDSLSGGESKAALARALIVKPEVLLLDEPLSALDPETREMTQAELRRLHGVLKSTIVHVTHDFEEAMTLGTRIAVIGDGQVRQVGPPEQIFRHPKSVFVARFALMRNIFSGEISGHADGKAIFSLPGMNLSVITNLNGPGYAAIRSEDILIVDSNRSQNRTNLFSGKITQIIDKGATVNITVGLPPDITVMILRNQLNELGLQVGDSITLYLDPALIRVFSN